ncbi:sulfite exporter TauE/SafE family protein [Anderseniella sp. Alg231-50]|uniref:sulfite exporter TauE/SafE family protein n=1 Tax=Anderseniella sp. Alg231-50 TaxID=1922226 RepID=UPI00307CBBFD
MWTPEILALLAVTFVAAGFVKGTIGLGLPTVTLAVLTLPLGLKTSLAVVVIPLMVTNLWQALTGPHLKEILTRFWPFLLTAIVGVWGGIQVLAAARSDYLVAMLGIILVLNSLISFTRFRTPAPAPERETLWSVICSALGGLMFGMTGNFIVPGILFLQALGMHRDMLVQALGVTFVTISTTLAVSLTSRSLMTGDLTVISTLALIPAFFGLWLGRRYRQSISEAQFSRLFFIGLLIIGCSLLFGSIRNLMAG